MIGCVVPIMPSNARMRSGVVNRKRKTTRTCYNIIMVRWGDCMYALNTYVELVERG